MTAIRATPLSQQMHSALTTPDNMWSAIKNPLRGVEVRALLRHRKDWFHRARGEWGETPLHWAALADFGLLLEEIQAGLDPNALDNHGRTPFDWLTDRLVAGVVQEPYRLPADGRAKLLHASEETGLALWAQGGRPGSSPESQHAGRAWMTSGAWSLLAMWEAEEKVARPWSPEDSGPLHHWGVAPESRTKHEWLSSHLTRHPDPDPLDRRGRTPLWYIADARRYRPHHAALLESAWSALCVAGADPEISDVEGISAGYLWLLP